MLIRTPLSLSLSLSLCVCVCVCFVFFLDEQVKREHDSFVGSKDERLAVDRDHLDSLGGCLDAIESLR